MDRREFLFQRKNRCVGQLLDRLEKTVFDKLSDSEQEEVRRLVKVKISAYHRDALDLMDADGIDMGINALAVKERDRQR